jgi:uncharacterized protein (TIGR02118 family)
MHKLVIMIGKPEDPSAFEASWPSFLHLAEAMPGLQREITSRASHQIFGEMNVLMVHELLFDSKQEALEALRSSEGQAAGQTLQTITQGNVELFLAEHHEDSLENIRRGAEESDES